MKRKRTTSQSVQAQYTQAAQDGGAACHARARDFDPLAHAPALGYSAQELSSVPQGSVMGLGCGNPTALAGLQPGQTVLDLGCGGGLDAFLAARKVGSAGQVIGVDVTPAMIEKATRHAREGDYRNVVFKTAAIECLPLETESVDVAISNCVLNHCADKTVAFREILRVLKPSGALFVADLVVEGVPEDVRKSLDQVWAEWIAGALDKRAYLAAIRTAGFKEITVLRENSYRSPSMDSKLDQKIVGLQVQARK